MASEAENEMLIKKLRNVRENICQLIGMFNKIEQWRQAALAAKADIDSALYDLTGDEFYKNN